MNEENTLNIPGPLFNRLQEYLKLSSFGTVDDLVTFILQDYLDHQDISQNDGQSGEDAEVMKRLQDLGYM